MKKNLRNNVLFLIIITFILVLPFVSFGQVNLDPNKNQVNLDPNKNTNQKPASSGIVENPLKSVSTIDGFIKVILEGVIKIGIPIIALAIIYSGILFVAARGAPDKLKKAKDALMYTLIGAAILLGSWAIAQIISNTVLAL
jgi:hypothetical protein